MSIPSNESLVARRDNGPDYVSMVPTAGCRSAAIVRRRPKVDRPRRRPSSTRQHSCISKDEAF